MTPLSPRAAHLWWSVMARREVVAAFDPQRLAAARERAGMTITDLAEHAGLVRQNVNTMETGSRTAGFASVRALAAALNIDPLELTTIDPAAPTLTGIRLQRGISRADLADAIDMTYNWWWRIESGDRPIPDDTARKAADILGVDVDTLIAALERQVDQ